MPKRTLSIQDLFKLQAILSVKVSPDGAHAVAVVQSANVDEQRNETKLWLWSREDHSFRKLTKGPADRSPCWLDNDTICFISGKREEEEKQEKVLRKSRLYTLSLRGGEPMLRATLNGIVFDVSPSPNGKQLALSYSPHPEASADQLKIWEKAPRPLESRRFRLRMDGMGDIPDELPGVYVLSTTADEWKKPKAVSTTPEFWHGNIQWTPDGKKLLFTASEIDLKMPPERLFVSTLAGKKDELTVPDGHFTAYAISPDGKRVAFCANEGTLKGGFKAVPLCVRSTNPKDKKYELIASNAGNFGEQRVLSDLVPMSGGHLTWEDNESILAICSIHGNSQLMRVGLDGSRESLSPEEGQTACFSANGGTIVFAHNTATDLPELYVIGRHKPVSKLNKAAANRFDIEPRAWFVSSEKNADVEAFLWATDSQLKSKKKRSLPLVLYVHGGPHVATGNMVMHEYTWLAHEGYAVVTANPRGSTGYGDDHGLGIFGNWGDRDVFDLLAVLKDTLKKYPQFDPKRVFIAGGSYGGYMTNWMLTRHPGVFRAGVTQRSVVNEMSFAGTSDFSNVFPPFTLGIENIFENPTLAWERSPLSKIKDVRDPLLILHSDNDWRCHVSEAHQLFVALVETGKKINEDVRMVIFKGESHGLSRGGRPENRRIRLEEVLGWIKKHDQSKSRSKSKSRKNK